MDRAVLAMDIAMPPPQSDSGRWHWLLEPPDIHDPSLRWYIDGSRRYPKNHELASTGCGLAVVDAEDQLVGLANAAPPAWVSSSSAAETWALYLSLREVVVIPAIITDCMGLINAARAGFEAATSAKLANARIWKLVDDIVDGQMAPVRNSLTWIRPEESFHGGLAG